LRLAVRLQPRARRTAIDGVVIEADGSAALKIAVTAPPEDGKANAALVALLGKAWRLPKSAIAIVGGAAQRRKVLLLSGDPASLAVAIAPYLE
jgi:uncharacterized protein (TIGR00251 family)